MFGHCVTVIVRLAVYMVHQGHSPHPMLDRHCTAQLHMHRVLVLSCLHPQPPCCVTNSSLSCAAQQHILVLSYATPLAVLAPSLSDQTHTVPLAVLAQCEDDVFPNNCMVLLAASKLLNNQPGSQTQ